MSSLLIDFFLSLSLFLYICKHTRPKPTYAASTWQYAAKFHQLLLQRVQNRATRMLIGHPRDTSIIIQLHEFLPLLQDVTDSQCRSFWLRMHHSQYEILHNLGTAQLPVSLIRCPVLPNSLHLRPISRRFL